MTTGPVKPKPSKPGSGPVGAKDTRPAATASVYEERTARRIAKKPDYDPKRFDVRGYVPKAQALARELAPKARLVSFEVDAVGDDGRGDLGLHDNGYAKYYFQSPVQPCALSVVVVPEHVITWIDDDDDGCGSGRALPACTVAQIHARGGGEGHTYAGERVMIRWTGARWEIHPDDAGTEELDDDCSKPVAEARPAPAEKTAAVGTARVIERPFPSAAGFEPRAYRAKALALARELESDAELVQVDATGVAADGAINGARAFKFRSAAAIASTDPDRLNCITVSVQPWDEKVVRASKAVSRCERDREIAGPKCRLTQVLARLSETPEGEVAMKLDDQGWRVWGAGVNEVIPDDCK